MGRALKFLRFAFLVVLTILANVYLDIWEKMHKFKIFPGT
jgi:hypothetical protein